MSSSHCQPKARMFGVALDASDDPMSLELKRASMARRARPRGAIHADPYEAVAEVMGPREDLRLAGKFSVPSWLGPRPSPADGPFVTVENFRRFYEGGGFLSMSEGVRDFVKERIFPEAPVMIGIDHSSTGGVVSALSGRYGARDLAVIVLDRHFDGIALSHRLETRPPSAGNPGGDEFSAMPFSSMGRDEYCCGSFWAHLLDAGIILPRNLLVIGVADYPHADAGAGPDRFRDQYRKLEERGCRFFPLRRFAEPYIEDLGRFIAEHITSPYLYVSLDVDVGSWNCVHAARYMDGPGIGRGNLRDISAAIVAQVRGGATSLVGFDVMEFNMHFLGIQTRGGLRDQTLEVTCEFIEAMLPCVNGSHARMLSRDGEAAGRRDAAAARRALRRETA